MDRVLVVNASPVAESVDPPVGEGELDRLILWMLSLSPAQRIED